MLLFCVFAARWAESGRTLLTLHTNGKGTFNVGTLTLREFKTRQCHFLPMSLDISLVSLDDSRSAGRLKALDEMTEQEIHQQ